MALFKRKRRDDEPLGPDERSPQLGLRAGDLQLLGALIENGADLTEPRHTIHFLYVPSADGARAVASELSADGFEVEVKEPLEDFPDSWTVVAELHDVVVDPEHVRVTSDRLEELAARHGGDYDGWEASV